MGYPSLRERELAKKLVMTATVSSRFLHCRFLQCHIPSHKRSADEVSAMREHHHKKALPSMSIKIAVLCGLMMLFWLRGTLWAGDFRTPIQDFREVEKHQMVEHSRIGWKESGKFLTEDSIYRGKAIQEMDMVKEGNERWKLFKEAELVKQGEKNEVDDQAKPTEDIKVQVGREDAREGDSSEKPIQDTKLVVEAEVTQADKSYKWTGIQVRDPVATEVHVKQVMLPIEEGYARAVGNPEKLNLMAGSQVGQPKTREADGKVQPNQENGVWVGEEDLRNNSVQVDEAKTTYVDSSGKSNRVIRNQFEGEEARKNSTQQSDIEDEEAEARQTGGSKRSSDKTDIQVGGEETRENLTKGTDVPLAGAEIRHLDETEKLGQQTNVQVGEEHAREVEPIMPYSLGPKVADWDEHRQDWIKKHAEWAKSANGKPRILLVSGSQPQACANALGDHYHVKSMKNKVDYCRLHGIEFFYNMAFLDKVMTGFWAKLPLLRKLMLSHPEIEWFWWMDSDAVFTDMLFELPIERYNDYNMIVPGRNKEVYEDKHWVGLNTGCFLIRNCQWSLDILDAWAPMGPDGKIREEAGRLLTKNLVGRPEFQADDQSALIYLLINEKDKWVDKVLLESSYTLHGFWLYLVDRYEELMEKSHPGLGDDRWPFVTHFVGCKPCSKFGDYPMEQCLKQMERAFNFADNQVLQMYGFQHLNIETPEVKWIGNRTVSSPLQELYHHPSFNSMAL